MSVNFASPSMRAAGSDLTVSISPLGLVELADEEFEVHGPRLNRYAQNFAFYLGHHWAYRRESGEPQTTFNYVRALSDFITNFTFSRGVEFQTPKETEHIIPGLLKKVWEVDNNKTEVLWEMGQNGGVTGDCFVKIAWDPAFEDSEGNVHPGRCRILPLNPAYAYPEWHPHDRERLLRFKLKYRFYGTTIEGTRTVMTYTEIITDDTVEEYLNDELIDQRPNPLGAIPVVHIPNVRVSGSPWGLSDITDVIPLNREYNEKSLEISDIINYHAAPVTIITGAKASNLERGPKKVWSLPSDKATAFNLAGGTEAIPAAMTYLQMLKTSMHEMTGVPESALGQMQPISNTSGVALSIQFQPMMHRYHMKQMTYTVGLDKINEYVLRTLFHFDPYSLMYDPSTDGVITDADIQMKMLDPQDPSVFRTFVHWPPPLPVDTLVKLNEIIQKFQVGLESKAGALSELGEEFPHEKLQEIFDEQLNDAKFEGAMSLLKAQIQSVILQTTGISIGEGEPPNGNSSESESDSGGPSAGSAGPVSAPSVCALGNLGAEELNKMTTEIVTQAYGTKFPWRRNPDNLK